MTPSTFIEILKFYLIPTDTQGKVHPEFETFQEDIEDLIQFKEESFYIECLDLIHTFYQQNMSAFFQDHSINTTSIEALILISNATIQPLLALYNAQPRSCPHSIVSALIKLICRKNIPLIYPFLTEQTLIPRHQANHLMQQFDVF